MECSMCEEATQCHEIFTCSICHRDKNSCQHKIGSFDDKRNICDKCFEHLQFGPYWIWTFQAIKHKGLSDADKERLIDVAILEALKYQNGGKNVVYSRDNARVRNGND